MKRRKNLRTLRSRTGEADLIAGAGMIAGINKIEGMEEIAEKNRDEGQPFFLFVIVQPIPSEKNPS